jgi:hypothetical protein
VNEERELKGYRVRLRVVEEYDVALALLRFFQTIRVSTDRLPR